MTVHLVKHENVTYVSAVDLVRYLLEQAKRDKVAKDALITIATYISALQAKGAK